MNKYLLNLQLFGEGDGGAAATGDGTEAGGAAGQAENGLANQDLSNVIYGKASEETADPHEETFEDLIKGRYKDDFNKRVQGILKDRFKQNAAQQEQMDRQSNVLNMLASRYGVEDPTDLKAIQKALEEDDGYLEEEALREGLTVKQLKNIKAMERENAQLKAAHDQAERNAHAEQIYSDWMNQGQQFAESYGIEGFDFEAEAQNQDFLDLLAAGVSVENAYKAIHFDEMMGGAMAFTAKTVKEKVAKNISTRRSRPAENGVSSQNAQIFKSDPSKFTNADIDEILARVARGEKISF